MIEKLLNRFIIIERLESDVKWLDKIQWKRHKLAKCQYGIIVFIARDYYIALETFPFK